MKYLLPLLLLAGCESFPEKKEEAHLMEQIPLGETWVDDMIDDSIKTDDQNRYVPGAASICHPGVRGKKREGGAYAAN